MIFMDVSKLRTEFDHLTTDIEAVLNEKDEFEREIARVQLEVVALKARHAKQLFAARRTMRRLRKELKVFRAAKPKQRQRKRL